MDHPLLILMDSLNNLIFIIMIFLMVSANIYNMLAEFWILFITGCIHKLSYGSSNKTLVKTSTV